jgi:SAM-dependent methyltransferase
MSTSNSRKALGRTAGMPAADRAMWTRLYAEAPNRKFPWMTQGPFPPLVRAVKDGWVGPPSSILDVGCGVGTNTFWLTSQGFRATGLDIAPGAIAAAQAHCKPGARHPKFVVDDVLASGLKPGRYQAAVDVGCFHTLPPRTRGKYSISLSRLLSPGAPLLLFWVAREEAGAWGPPHRMSVSEVMEAFETLFLIDRIEYRARNVRLTQKIQRSARPLATLAGYSARLLRRAEPQPRAR